MTRSFRSTVAEGVRRLLIASGLDRALAEVTQGVAPGSLRARLTPTHVLYSSPTVRMARRRGLEFELDVSDYMQWCAYYGIATEPRDALYGLVHRGATVLDVGTNVGETLLGFATLVGPTGRVYGFEVNPHTYRRCERNVARNALRNVRLMHLGLGDVEAVMRLDRPTLRNSGGDRLRPDLGGTAALPSNDESEVATRQAAVEVRVTTLDGFVEREKIVAIDLVKIDVEGFETNVVRGAKKTLAALRPTLFVEVSDSLLRASGSSGRELVDEIAALGYEVRRATDGMIVTAAMNFEGTHFDVIGQPMDAGGAR